MHFIPYKRSHDHLCKHWRHEIGLFVDVETVLLVTAILWVGPNVCDSIVFVCGIDAAAILYDLP